MSGYIVVVNVDGSPVDPAQVRRLTDTLKFRGPDAQNVWVDGQIGLGHAMLRTTDGTSRECQPCGSDGLWLTGDVRIDGRTALIGKLRAAGQAIPPTASDAELVLCSYRAWGQDFPAQLLGDFSFALWDSHRRQLVCARDQLGVKPLFYARVGNQLIAGNTLICLRSHSDVTDDLNDAAVGDFLLFGFNCNPQTTTFQAIQRLPGGHLLTWTPGAEVRIRRYWSLRQREELRLPTHQDYLERFDSILTAAVSDRTRTDRVAINMSGGLDSPLIAATVKKLMASGQSPTELKAYTVVYDHLFPDEERHFSQLVAESLDIPIDHLPADNYQLFDAGSIRPFPCPEPFDVLARPSFFDAVNNQVETRFRVVLSGFDGDALLHASFLSQLRGRARAGQLGSLAADILSFARAKQGLFQAMLRRLPFANRRGPVEVGFPEWLNPAFALDLGLEDRWKNMFARHEHGQGARNGAFRAMTLETWLPILEGRDAGVTGVAVDHRHPLLDLRMVEFALSLPAIPWCVDKYIFRQAARGILPEPVRTRPKSPLAGDPLPSALRSYLAALQPLKIHPALSRYVDVGRLDQVIDEAGSAGYWIALRVLVLNFWLFNVQGDNNDQRQ